MIEYTGFLFTDTYRLVRCPKCGAEPQAHCATPKGRKAWPPHSERVEVLCAAHPQAVKAASRRLR